MKTNETSICRKCGGNGKPSKGYMNFHNIQFPNDKSKAEFETKLLDCIKCELCGHSWIPNETSTREQAIAWWNDFSIDNKQTICNKYFTYHSSSLTDKEIEEIWSKETKNGFDKEIVEEAFPDLKPNQKQSAADEIIELVGEDNFKQIIKESDKRVNAKQFKKFNPDLFESYIEKFSDEDKVKALETLLNSFNKSYKIQIEGFITELQVIK